MERTYSCPLGHQCEQVVGGKIDTCQLYIKMVGTDAEGKQRDEWNCSLNWTTTIALENANQIRKLSAAVDSLRNEQIQRQDAATDILKGAMGNVKIIDVK